MDFRKQGWSRVFKLAVVSTMFWVAGVHGQQTEVVCDVLNLVWSFNSLHQSPCLVVAFLVSPCFANDDYDVPALTFGYAYGPSPTPTPCECTTVAYSLLSACGACQGDGLVGNWSDYSQNCTETSPDGQYNLAIPPGTAVPAWAFQQVEETDLFNLTLAQDVGDKPEKTAEGLKGNKPISAIVGGVVGGVGGSVVIGTLLGLYLRRKRNQNTSKFDNSSDQTQRPPNDPAKTTPLLYSPVATNDFSLHKFQQVNSVSPITLAKLYDPEDHSAYPSSPGLTWSDNRPTIDVPITMSSEYDGHGHTQPRLLV